MSQSESGPLQQPQSQKTASKGAKGKKSKRWLRKQAQIRSKRSEQDIDTTSVTEESTAQEDSIAEIHPKPNAQANARRNAKPAGRKRHPPSKESGGVPEPTAQYLLNSQAPSFVLPAPRRILIVMDLNGTLLHRPNKKRPFHFIDRPHARSFLSYCLDNFTVAIWSSAQPDNVEKMVHRLLTPEQVKKCVLIWGRDKFGLSATDYDSRVQCYKRLTRIWSDPNIVASHPISEAGGRWDQSNTVLVDDSREKARSEPHNILEIPDFTGLAGEPANVLPQVHDYINNLCYQSNISGFIREHPFRLDPQYKLAVQD